MANEDLSKLKIDKSAQAYRPVRSRKFMYVIGIIVLFLVIGILYGTGVLKPAVEVEVANVTQVYPSQTFTQLNASGYVVAQRKAAVASKVTGRLITLMVEEGNKVKKGEMIARLENEDVTASRDQAAAALNAAGHNLELAQADLTETQLALDRYKELLDGEFVSKSSFETAEARYKKARAAVEAAKAEVNLSKATLHGAEVAVEYTMIRAPFDAVVLTKNADVGDIITPIGAAADAKAAVVNIADMDSLLVEVDVSESNLQLVKIGQPCEIQLDALPDARFRGKVHMIIPTADRTKATILVKVSFIDKDSRILPEMSAKVAFLSRDIRDDEQKPRTALLESAILAHNSKKSVFLIHENRVEETPISVGDQFGDMVEILRGVKAGDRVVLSPLEKIKNGSRIKIPEK
jgi:RND family efflux transporter MFP subunit